MRPAMRSDREQSTETIEKRRSPRFDHASQVRIKVPQSEKLHNAMMVNYSKDGIYIESDSQLNCGTQVKIGIKNSPYAGSPDTVEYFRGIILWCQELDNSFYQFGYGVQLIK
jgi:hypothetical protein